MVRSQRRYVLHGLENNRIFAHTEVVVGAPHIDLLFDIACMSDRELGSETVDVVEIAVTTILVFFLEFGVIKLLEIEASLDVNSLRFVGERACRGHGRGLGTPGDHLSQLLGLEGSLCTCFGVRAHSLTSGEGKDALALVNLVNVRPVG